MNVTIIFYDAVFFIFVFVMWYLLHLLTSHRKLKGLWIFGEPLWTLDPSEKSIEMAATIVDIIYKHPAQHDLFTFRAENSSGQLCYLINYTYDKDKNFPSMQWLTLILKNIISNSIFGCQCPLWMTKVAYRTLNDWCQDLWIPRWIFAIQLSN